MGNGTTVGGGHGRGAGGGRWASLLPCCCLLGLAAGGRLQSIRPGLHDPLDGPARRVILGRARHPRVRGTKPHLHISRHVRHFGWDAHLGFARAVAGYEGEGLGALWGAGMEKWRGGVGDPGVELVVD